MWKKYIYRDCLWEIGSYNYGEWEVPWSDVCKLEAQKGSWYNSVQRAENQGSRWCKFQLEGWRRYVPAQSVRWRWWGWWTLLSYTFCFIQSLSRLDEAQPHWGEQFTDSINSDANPIWKNPHRHTQKQCLVWAPVSNWYMKLTITIPYKGFGMLWKASGNKVRRSLKAS